MRKGKKMINREMKKRVLCCLLIQSILFIPYAVCAEHYYVRPDNENVTYNEEDGSDWNNAFNGFKNILWGSSAGKVSAGDIVYLSGGAYTSSISPGTSGVGDADTNRIILRRATIQSHGNSNGWDNSLDSEVMIIGGASIVIEAQSYITIDGVTSYGINVESSSMSGKRGVTMNNAHNIILQYIKVDGTINGNDFRGIYCWNSQNININNCWLANLPNDGLLLGSVNELLIEKCTIGPRITSSTGKHADAIEIRDTSNVVFKYNTTNWNGDGIHFGIEDGVSGPWHIYGNIFTGGGSSQAIKTNSDNPSVGPIYIYHNVFYNLYRSIASLSGTFGYAKNNIFWDVMKAKYDFGGGISHDYNYFKDGVGDQEPQYEEHGVKGENPFVDAGSNNFRIANESSAVNAGMNLSDQYEIDPDNNIRGNDGFWDIGAFENIDSVNEPPASPSNLRVE
ncbi:right-handed parallel beta-helix repeat-containing protein [Thermodesulfobacteriota bacterium]